MPKATIVKVVNLAREIEEEMPTSRMNKWSQPLLGNDDLDEELVNDEHKKERRKNRKEWNDGYRGGAFCQKYHNEGHLIKECKLL